MQSRAPRLRGASCVAGAPPLGKVSPTMLQTWQARHGHTLEAPQGITLAQRLRRLPNVFRCRP
jgi:hypothetical protein